MRYDRQELIIGKDGQKKLRKSKVVIVGLGALGGVVADLLVRAGVGGLVLIDRDLVDLSNLQRQTLFREDDIGKPKVFAAKDLLNKINSDVTIVAYFEDLNFRNVDLMKEDLILDCSDNLETKFLINEYCVKNGIPLVFGSALRFQGYIFNVVSGVCLKCVFRDSVINETCETAGVFNTVTNLIASVQANEAIKILLGKEYEKSLLYFNLENNNLERIKVKKYSNCAVCSGVYEYLDGGKQKEIVKYCGDGYIFYKKFDSDKVRKNLERFNITDFGGSFKFKNMLVFSNSIMIKANSESEARSFYSKYVGN